MPSLKFNKKLEKLFTATQQIIVIVGGRGSGKSIAVGDFLTFKMATEGADVYCLREFQDSINDSVHRVFEDSIEKRMMLKGWEIQKNTVIAPNGAMTTYKGANRNPDSMQSAQGYKYSWFEEAHRASQDSIDKLLPTILRNPGAKCIFTANPQSSADPFSQRFIVPYLSSLEADGYYEDDLHLVIVANWRDNPWWNKEQEQLRSWDYANLSRAKYDWIWEGKFNDGVENAIVEPEWFDAAIDACEKLGIKPSGSRITSFDPADEGEDSKAYASRYGIHFDDFGEFTAKDANEACDMATELAISNRSDMFVWDGDGMGAVLRRQIDKSLSGKNVEIRMYKGSMGVDYPEKMFNEDKRNRDMFYNKRSQYYTLLAERFRKTYLAVEKKQYIDPDELISISSKNKLIGKLRAEVCGIPRVINGTGKIQLMKKSDMKRKLNRDSPGMADCLAMAMESPSAIEPVDINFEGWG